MLMQLLLSPPRSDSQENPLPVDPADPTSSCFYELPNDGRLREEIVNVLMRGPLVGSWKRADNLLELATTANWGTASEQLHPAEVSMAAVALDRGMAGEHVDSLAETLGVQPGTLRRKASKARKK